jgi:hypothetical protein
MKYRLAIELFHSVGKRGVAGIDVHSGNGVVHDVHNLLGILGGYIPGTANLAL